MPPTPKSALFIRQGSGSSPCSRAEATSDRRWCTKPRRSVSEKVTRCSRCEVNSYPRDVALRVVSAAMNGTIKSVLAAVGLWFGAEVSWAIIVGLCAAAAGSGRGWALTVAMLIAWASALVLSIGVVLGAKVLLWTWMAPGAPRVVLLLALAVVQLATLVMNVFSVFVIFNR